MTRLIKFTIILIFFLHTGDLMAEDKADRWGVGFFPVIGYDDDTSLTLGATSVFYFNPAPDNPQQELDELELNANFSLKGHYNFAGTFSKNLNDNRDNLETTIGFSRAYDSFYGIGGDTLESNEETYSSRAVPLKISYSIGVWKDFYIGAAYDFRYVDITDVDADKILASGKITGSEIMHSSGFGIKLTYKTTKPGLYKREGFKLSFSSLYYSPVIGSSSSFQTTKIDYRHYIPLIENWVLGLQLRGERCSGDVPFYYLPSVGGSKILRGFGSGRYIANNQITAQTELRFPIWRRLGGAAFIGAGEVAEHMENFGTNIKYAGGLGLRVTLQKKQNINLRLDFAMSSDGETKKYIKIQEAF